MRYLIQTFGCKTNWNDTQSLEFTFRQRGWEESKDSPQVCIINSCTVTDEAERQSRKAASKLKRVYPDSRVIITGCSAEVSSQSLLQTPGVDYVIGNRSKNDLVELIERALKNPESKVQTTLGLTTDYTEYLSRHPIDREWPEFKNASYEFNRTRAFLKIQDGCNSFCTYCIIPYARGPSRSLDPKQVIKQINELVHQGTQEVILTGVNLGDYGVDLSIESMGLDTLIETILEQTSLSRLRVSSLDPTEITPKMLNLLETSNERFCPHFHVSLQSPNNKILKLMKRKYRELEVEKCLVALSKIPIQSPGGVFVGMDVITGFPGETLEDFEWTLKKLEELPWTRLHVFPYSERKGTPATKLTQSVELNERKRRAQCLRSLSLNRMKTKYLDILNQTSILENVLIEGDGCSGYTSNYYRVVLDVNDKKLRNQQIAVKLKEIKTDLPSGEVNFEAVTNTLNS